jgi:hypothetical protein
VGLLVPFSQACYENQYPLNAISPFSNLVLAHVDVEPMAEEEVATSQHQLILLSQVTHLSASAAQALERYVERGGTVLLDRECKVPLNGAQRLDVSFSQGTDHQGAGLTTYALPERVAAIRQALAPYLQPQWDSPEITTVIRPFVDGEGARYAYVIQVDNTEEFVFFRRNIYEVATFGQSPEASPEAIDQFLKDHGMNSHLQDTTMTVEFDEQLLPTGGKVVDVYRGETLQPQSAGEGRRKVLVQARRFGGTLLAF